MKVNFYRYFSEIRFENGYENDLIFIFLILNLSIYKTYLF